MRAWISQHRDDLEIISIRVSVILIAGAIAVPLIFLAKALGLHPMGCS